MRSIQSSLLLISCITLLISCGQGDSANSSSNKFSYCNKKSNNLADYSKCRCGQITGAKSYNQEMMDCMATPKLYAEGFEGEIPQRILDLMNE